MKLYQMGCHLARRLLGGWRRGVVAACLAAACTTPALAQARHAGRARPASPVDTLPRDTSVTIGTLPNGLRYYIRVNRTPAQRAELRLAVDAGSTLEDSTQRGLAHFVEHMAFNGTTHFGRLEIKRYLESMGMAFGADVNAETSHSATVYRFTVPTDRPDAIPTGVRILADWVHGVTFDSATVEAERGIIMGEWRSGAGWTRRVAERYYDAALAGSRYAARMPIGLPSVIEHAPRSEIVRFYRDWYRPEHMAVVIVGDVDARAVERLLRKELGGIRPAGRARPRPALDVPVARATATVIVADSEAGRAFARVSYRLPAVPHGTYAGVRQQILERMIAYMSSAHVQQLPRSTTGLEDIARDVPMLTFNSEAADGDPRPALAALLAIGRRVVQHGFSDAELAQVRAFMTTQYETQFANLGGIASATLADGYVRAFLIGARATLPEPLKRAALAVLNGDSAITLAEVNAAARAVLAHPTVILVAGPASLAQLVTERDLRALADSVAASDQAADDQQIADTPLLPTRPAPGHVVRTRALPVGATEWTLSNGARVVLRPTDFGVDEVLVRAIAPGGTSVAADSDYISASLAASMMGVGGLGAFTHNALQTRLRAAGSTVSVSPFVTDVMQGVSGTSNWRDAESLFQLIYLSFTAPRADTAAIATWRTTTKEALSTIDAGLGQVLQSVLTQRHPRARPITPPMLDSLDIGRAAAFYRARFADASAFTFYIVGTFDLDSIKPLVERYLGGLPATHANETWRDNGVRMARGPGNIDVPLGPAGKTTTRIIIADTAAYDKEQVYVFDALRTIAEQRLFQRLRTDLHSTYGVGVALTATAVPYPHFQLELSFDADPAQADSLARVALATLDTLRADGPTPQEVYDVRELLQRRTQNGQRNNGYWLQMLSDFGWDGWDFATGITSVDPLLDAITSARIKVAAQRVLDTSHVIRITIHPRNVAS